MTTTSRREGAMPGTDVPERAYVALPEQIDDDDIDTVASQIARALLAQLTGEHGPVDDDG
jgi:hypothetical protein